MVYPLDPMGPKIGGSASFIRGLVEHAPAALNLRFIGITCDASKRPPMRWMSQQLGGRGFEFLPVLNEPHEDQRRTVPLSLRFVRRLSAAMFPDDGAVLFHNRPETVLAPGMARHHNLVFIHNDVPEQVGSGAGEVLWSRFPWLYYQFERLIFRRADRVYTVSTNTLADCRKRYPRTADKFAFVPTWVDTARFSPSDEPPSAIRARLVARGLGIHHGSENGAESAAPWILYVGRLQPQKAPQRLLDAFMLLRQRWPQAQLIVIGDGNLRSAVEARIAREDLGGCVHLLGVMAQAELPNYYRAADLLLLASDYEGMPMCVLEALACGLPVATTRVGEVARVVLPGITGEIAHEPSAEGVAAAAARVLEQPRAYDPQVCAATIGPLSPQQVLAPIYAQVGELTRRRSASNSPN